MKKNILIALSIVSVWFIFIREEHISLGSGVFAPETPEQIMIESPQSFSFKDYTITPMATFNIKAKVLSIEQYYSGRESDLSPVDFALGWGNMSDESILASIDISQSNRWYRWHVEKFPIPRRELEMHSANMHLIPANGYIESMIDNARTGDIVAINGALVKVDAQDGWHWSSSLTRADTGNHACELVWVERFEILNP